MRDYNRFPIYISLTMLLLIFSSTSLANEITPQEINAKECKKVVDSLFDEFAPKSEDLRRDSVLGCTNRMNNNYKNGLPSYATHTPSEMQRYEEERGKKDIAEIRARHKDTLKKIATSCAKPVAYIYSDMYTKKLGGESKKSQVAYLRRAALEPRTILDGILINLSYKALDEIYSKTGPATDNEVANRIVVFYGKCTEMYEQSLFLR